MAVVAQPPVENATVKKVRHENTLIACISLCGTCDY